MVTIETINKSAAAYPVFISREQDILNRARQLKRISFVVFSGTTDQYMTAIGAMQEKIVEAFKTNTSVPILVQVSLF